MRRIYITFGGAAYDKQTEIVIRDAPRFGADEVWVYDDAWILKQEFYQLNKWLWTHRGPGNPIGGRGFGWFCWKPFIIMHALDRLAPGDMVLYVDGDTYPVADFSVLYELCREQRAVFFKAQGCSNRQWVKRDCWQTMACSHLVKLDSDHAVARFMLFQAGQWKPRQLLIEWLTYCLNPLATTFDKSTIGAEYIGFEEHRTEQAILSLLVHKYGYRLYREACQFGDGHVEDQDLYPTLFHQDGSRISAGLEGSRFANIP